jgi:hydroxymethylpyrimidine/phosphomethylpyrimidine kinase
MEDLLNKKHKNRRKVFPNAHIPYPNPLEVQMLVNMLTKQSREQLMKIFEETPEEFRAKNIKLGSELQSLFKNNILFLCDFHGISQRKLFKLINFKGIKGSSAAFLQGNGKKHFSLLYLAMFSRIFNIEAGMMLFTDFKKLFHPQ